MPLIFLILSCLTSVHSTSLNRAIHEFGSLHGCIGLDTLNPPDATFSHYIGPVQTQEGLLYFAMFIPTPPRHVQVFNIAGEILFDRILPSGIRMIHVMEAMLESIPDAKLRSFVDFDTQAILKEDDVPPSKITCVRPPLGEVISKFMQEKGIVPENGFTEDQIMVLGFCVDNFIDYQHYKAFVKLPLDLMTNYSDTLKWYTKYQKAKFFMRRFFERSSLESIIATEDLGRLDRRKVSGSLVGDCIMKSLAKGDLPIRFWKDTLYKYQWHLLAKITREKNQFVWTKVMESIGTEGGITQAEFSELFINNNNIESEWIGVMREVHDGVFSFGRKSKYMGMLLHLAAMHANDFVIRDLLQMGASKTVKDKNGKIPFDLLPRKASKALRKELKPDALG